MSPIQNLKAHGTKWLGVLGSIAGVVAMTMTPEQIVAILGAKGPGAVVLVGGILTYLRGRYNTKQNATLPAPDPGTVVKSHWLVGMLVAAVTFVCLHGCATQPTRNQAIGIDALAGAAVAIAVQRDTSDPATWSKRARLIVSVVDTVRPLANDDTVSVPAIAAAVGPVLDRAKLEPAQRVAANQLVAALVLIIDANTAPDSPQAATVLVVLDAVAKAAAVYTNLGGEPTASTIF